MRARKRALRAFAACALLGIAGLTIRTHYSLAQAPSGTKKADPEAYALLKRADEMRQTLPASFAGVAGEISVNDNGVTSSGRFSYTLKKGVDLNIDSISADAATWTKDAIGSSLAHRVQSDFDRGPGASALTMGPEDHSPIGRKVIFHDMFQSTDRVRDNQIVEVDRTMGKTRFIISVLENQVTDEGKFLPKQFVVTFFDAASGAIERTECFTDGFAKVEGAWLPTSRRVVTIQNGKSAARTFELRNLRLTTAGAASNAR